MRNLFELMDKLEKDLNLTPEQKFRVAADIKRYVHSEKYNLLTRLHMYFLTIPGDGVASEEFIRNTLDCKIETHKEFANLPDEEVITYEIGSFKPNG